MGVIDHVLVSHGVWIAQDERVQRAIPWFAHCDRLIVALALNSVKITHVVERVLIVAN